MRINPPLSAGKGGPCVSRGRERGSATLISGGVRHHRRDIFASVIPSSAPRTSASHSQRGTLPRRGGRVRVLALRREEAGRPPPITAEQRVWFNPELTSRYFLVPGSIAIVMTLVGTLLTSLVVAREWERGTMEAMMATPVTAAELLAGKVLPYFLLGLASMTLCVLLAVFLFGVPLRGSLLALYALSATFLMPALGQGLLISAATKNQFLASQLALISGFLPSFLLSGFLFEIDSMPVVIQWITLIVPARYLIPSLQTVFLAGDIWPMFLRAIAVMLLIGAAFFALAIRNTRKRIA